MEAPTSAARRFSIRADTVAHGGSIGESHQTVGLGEVLGRAVDLGLADHIDGGVHGGIAVEGRIDLDDAAHTIHVVPNQVRDCFVIFKFG